jgi:peptidoglycan/LPS O-acetylase OafA/YrhL
VRNGGLDYFRLLAAFGIVLFHSGAPGASIGYAGLPYFILMLPLFGLQTTSIKHFRSYIAHRANRLLMPWLVWSGIYGGLKVSEIVLTGADLSSEFQWWMLATGPALHLWFLPFAFTVSLFFPAFASLWSSANHLTQSAISALLLLVTLLMLMWWNSVSAAGPPFAQWAYAAPAVLMGLFISANWPVPRRRPIVTLACIMALGTAVFIVQADGSLQLAIASLAILLCLYVPLPESAAAKLCAETALTVYLVHPLVMSILQRGVHLESDSLMLAFFTILFSFVVAVVQALLIKRQPADSSAPK